MNKSDFIRTIIFLTSFLILPLNGLAFEASLKASAEKKFASAADFAFENDERVIFDLVNRERTKKGLEALCRRDDLSKLARAYSEKMARGKFFSHIESNGASVVERAERMKIKHWNKIGENLFYFVGAKDFDKFAVQKWMQSPEHRTNILDKDWTAAGLGIAESGDGEIYITQVFVEE